MDGNLFCGGTEGGGAASAGLPCLLILAAYALCLAARVWERGGLRQFRAGLRGTWASWPPALRAVMAGLLLACVRDGRCTKPENGGGGTDADGDGMPDAWERAFGLDPLDPSDAAGDLDRDGLTALEEFLNRTHPRRRDTDGDGMPDAWEAARRPFLCPWLPDDGEDADGDGLDNFHEMALGCDPANPDTNGDGREDGEEAGEGVGPALDPPDWATYGTGAVSVRVDGVRAARRADASPSATSCTRAFRGGRTRSPPGKAIRSPSRTSTRATPTPARAR